MPSEYDNWLEGYLEDLRRKGKMEGTIANNRKYCAAFARFCESNKRFWKPGVAVDEATVRAFACRLLEQRYTPKTVASMVGGVLQFERWLNANDGSHILKFGKITATAIVDDAVAQRRS